MDTVLASILTAYTTQLDEYERAITTITFTAIAALCTVVSIAFTVKSPALYLCATLVIPCLEAVYLFIFAHYTRWIAFYRGYCVHIEERLNALSGTKDFYFHIMVFKSGMKGFTNNSFLLKACIWGLYGVSVVCFVVAMIAAKSFPFALVGLIVFVLTAAGIWECLESIDGNTTASKLMER